MREGVFASPEEMSKVSLDKASPTASPFSQAGTHQAPADPTHGSSQTSLYAGTQRWCGTLRTCSQPWESFQGWEQERSSTLLFLQPHGAFAGHILRMDASREEPWWAQHARQRVGPFTMSQVPCPGWLKAPVRLPAPQSPAPPASPTP